MHHHRTLLVVSASGLLGILLLACAGGTPVAQQGARWSCPSPTPKPYGSDGPVKSWIESSSTVINPLGTPEATVERTPVYYEQWEQEYPTPGLTAFPSPTVYGYSGTTFVFGQRAEIAPFHLAVSASAGRLVTLPVEARDQLQLYTVHLTWTNPTGRSIPVRYELQVKLRAVTQANGAIRTDSGWGITSEALRQAGVAQLPVAIPASPAESSVDLPILAPPGTPQAVEVSFVTSGAGVPTPENATPTPNTQLQQNVDQRQTLSWTAGQFSYFGAPPCSDAGALTGWDSGSPVAVAVAAPPGTDRVVQLALNQVGKPYVWGAMGPETFDCSGLMTWAYAQIGIQIPRGTGRGGPGQWTLLKPASQSQLQPGDLVYFAIEGGGYADHVGMLIGDINGNGQWDMVHAASPKLGVRIDYDILNSHYYGPKILGFRTAR